MNMDERLLELYLSFDGPEAGPWNRSPQSLYIEYWTRTFLTERLALFPGMRVCNVGIGAGGWDNYLCDVLAGTGRLTSVDINPDICDLFRYRQRREQHPNAAAVLCVDILSDSLPAGSFDVVTVIGSTVSESGDYHRCLTSCWRLVRTSGFLMYMDFDRNPPERFEAWAQTNAASIRNRAQDSLVDGYAFWICRDTLPDV